MSWPTDLAMLVVIALSGRDDLTADEIAHRLGDIGIGASAQQVGAWLRRLGAEDCPCVESVRCYGWREYRLTRFGWTLLGNRWNAMRDIERGRRRRP